MEPILFNNQKYIIYSINSYKGANSHFIDNKKQSYNLNDLIDKLNEDKRYHFRIHNDTKYIFFGDLDHYKDGVEDFIEILQLFLKKHYNLSFQFDEFKYTKNNKLDDIFGSFHYTIPKWNLSIEKLKEIHINFLDKYKGTGPAISGKSHLSYIDDISGKDIKCVDTTIYSEHWFRCPNQSKSLPLIVNNQHIIINGSMIDFIIYHIPLDSISIDDSYYTNNNIFYNNAYNDSDHSDSDDDNIEFDNHNNVSTLNDGDIFDSIMTNAKNKHTITHISNGFKKGSFDLNDNILLQICEPYIFKNYALTELKTKFYKLMFSIDLKNINNKLDIITNLFIKTINDTLLLIYGDNVNTNYIFCNNDNNGIHIYYPNIIVSNKIHNKIYNAVFNIILKSKDITIKSDRLTKIFDESITKSNSLCLPYFTHNNICYKYNDIKSTHKIILLNNLDKLDKYNIIKQCSVNTSFIIPNHIIINNIIKLPTIVNNSNDINNPIDNLNNIPPILQLKPNNIKIIDKMNIDELDIILKCLSDKRFLNYATWQMMNSLIYNCNNTIEACKLFFIKSTFGPYKNNLFKDIYYKFYNNKTFDNFNINVLRYYARADNPKLFDTLILDIKYNKQLYDAIKFCSPKIVNIDRYINDGKIDTYIETLIINDNSLFATNSKFKFFMLKSPYGTGKSKMLETLCLTNRYTRIIFITHRQSLANSLMKNFSNLNFKNYLDKKTFDPADDRIIINIDSLFKLECTTYNLDLGKNVSTVYTYDLLILDEFTSLLYHFESNLMNPVESAYNIFHTLINDTPKVICCDGDLGNRELEYIHRFDNTVQIYENTITPRIFKYIIHYDEPKFIDMIQNDISNNLNVVFASMSATECNKIQQHFKDKCNILCITSITDDAIKNSLSDIENIITSNNIQLLIYSPAVTVGVDISISTYFNSIYGYLCGHSGGARDFCQMLNRVRNPISNTINILIDRSVYKSKIANYLDFDEIHHMIFGNKNIHKNNLSTYQFLRIWNLVEQKNNDSYIFPIFLQLITDKSHTYEIIDEKKKSIFSNLNIINIVEAININFSDMTKLLNKGKLLGLTRDEKLSIIKYYYAQSFNVPVHTIDENFLSHRFGKIPIVEEYPKFIEYYNNDGIDINDKTLFNMDNFYCTNIEKKLNKNSNNLSKEITNCFNNYDSVDLHININDHNIVTKRIHIKNLVIKMGFTKMNTPIPKKDFEINFQKIDDVIDDQFRILFELNKKEVYNLTKMFDTNKKRLGFLNTIIEKYGIVIKSRKKIIRIDKKQWSLEIYYELKLLDIISEISPIKLPAKNKVKVVYELINEE